MSKTTLGQPVYDLDGNVTTLKDLLDAGKATVAKCDHFYKRGNSTRVAYFVELCSERPDGTTPCFEVAAHVYNSRN